VFIQTFRFKKVTRHHEGTNEKSANMLFSLIIIIRLYISSFLCFNQRQLIAFQWLLNLILLTLDLLILLSDRQIVILERLGPLRTQLPPHACHSRRSSRPAGLSRSPAACSASPATAP